MAEEVVFDFSGGSLSLDFVNTVGDRPRREAEQLTWYGDLVTWGRQAGVLTPEEHTLLVDEAGRRIGQARKAFDRAIELRETLYRLFSAVAAEDRPDREDIETLNDTLSLALRHARITSGDDRYEWHWAGPADALDRMLWPVAGAAAELLTSDELPLVRECASDTCSWLFLDRSRNRSRRWCDMSTCGNRAKARRHYRRKRAAEQD
jgi:predicted RNA-binding Zn ribbon-like protein